MDDGDDGWEDEDEDEDELGEEEDEEDEDEEDGEKAERGKGGRRSEVTRLVLHPGEQAVDIVQHLAADYGLFVWPSAFLLADYIWAHQELVRDRHVVEIGAGTGLAGLAAAHAGARSVALTDRAVADGGGPVLASLQRAVRLNGLDPAHVRVGPLPWGDVAAAGTMAPAPDVVLGADCFYAVRDFENVIATVATLLRRGGPSAVFLTVYEERSARRTVQHLLDFWRLTARVVAWQPSDTRSLSSSLSPSARASLLLLAIHAIG